jgi:SWI/SNF-related matrix-associated actin-dependent regulator 1 of chromatin subfamily A
MPELFPHQITGASFLASRQYALLADEQRVGKTAAAIRAADYVLARNVLVVTKASARAQWGREFTTWGLPREVQVVYSGADHINTGAEVVIVGWPVVDRRSRETAFCRPWDAIILDESHEAKNPTAHRTEAVFGKAGLYKHARAVWCLSGTPVPNSPADLFPMIAALEPHRLAADPAKSFTDVSTYDRFVDRYCVVKPRRLGGIFRLVIKGGKNEAELSRRLAGLWLRRTQQDVGITRPIFSVMALHVERKPDEPAEMQAILDAAETGETKTLEMHLGPLRRLTGIAKAHAAVEAVAEMIEDGLDKIVLMAWHTEVIDVLKDGLRRFGVLGIDGRTSPANRERSVRLFQTDPSHHVFVGQILAAGEAIDLSAAAELWFVEGSFVPKDMAQAAMRITNHSQKRQALVRVCALAGSIDEAIAGILTRKVETIRKVMEQ